MDFEKLFDSFSKNEGKSITLGVTPETQDLVAEFKEHPLVKIGMFKKIILNYLISGNKMIEFFKSANIDLETNDIKKAGEHILYNRAWDFIKNINIWEQFHFESLKSMASDELVVTLNTATVYFEKFEEYEKCQHLNTLKKEVVKFLK